MVMDDIIVLSDNDEDESEDKADNSERPNESEVVNTIEDNTNLVSFNC